jgi:phenylacetate-CoA ligase
MFEIVEQHLDKRTRAAVAFRRIGTLVAVGSEAQLEKLRRQVAYLEERSPFYREKLRDAGVGSAALRSLDSLARFPLTTKQELRESQAAAPPLGRHACVELADVVRLHASTGTTGTPSWVGLTARDVETWTELTAASFRTQGIRSDDVVVHAAGLTLFVGGLPVQDAIERLGATFVPIGTGASEKVLGALRAFPGAVLHSTPSYALYLAEWLRERDVDPRSLRLRKLTCGGEPGAGQPAVRAQIEETWGAPVTEGLGNADVAPVIWGECEHQAGMHLTGGDWVAAELIDPEGEGPVAWEAGVEAELVYTALERECCGLLRFRTRDRLRVLGTDCVCGRPGPLVRCVGRTDDMLIVLGVNVFPAAIRDLVAELRPRTTGAMQVVLPRPGPRVEPPLRVEVEHAAGWDDLEALREALEERIRGRLTIPADVELVPPGRLGRSELKTALTRIEESR